MRPRSNPDDLLPVEQAFELEASASGNAIELTFDVAPGYYLYRHAFRFEPASGRLQLGEAEIPPGTESEDEFFGLTETYRDRLVITFAGRCARWWPGVNRCSIPGMRRSGGVLSAASSERYRRAAGDFPGSGIRQWS